MVHLNSPSAHSLLDARGAERDGVLKRRYEQLSARVRLPRAELQRAHAAVLALARAPAAALDLSLERAQFAEVLGRAAASAREARSPARQAGAGAEEPCGAPQAAAAPDACGALSIGLRLFDLLTSRGEACGADGDSAEMQPSTLLLPISVAVVLVVSADRKAASGIAALAFYDRTDDLRGSISAEDARELLCALERAFLPPAQPAALEIGRAVSELVGGGVVRWTTFSKLLARCRLSELVQA